MPSHWTYCQYDPGADLYQGDIIARTDPLLKVLEEVHQHFCDEKYLAFLVTSQTCDLVLRNQHRCKAKHITLAVIRALEDIVPDLFSEASSTGIEGVYRQEDKGGARAQLERILNQNEQAHGIFYLHPDADVRIAVHAVSLLRVSIALRSHEHYDLLQESRCGRLATEYRYKLGWLTGNLFSRVDTPDWSDHDGGAAEAEDVIEGFLDGSKLSKPNVWIPGSWLQSALKKNVQIKVLPRDQVYDALKAHAPRTRSEVVMSRLRDVGTKLSPLLGEDELRTVISGLNADAIFSMAVANMVAATVSAVLVKVPAACAALFDQIRNDATIRDSATARVEDAILSFQKHRGPHELKTLLDYYAAGPLLNDDAIGRIRQQVAALVPGVHAEQLDTIEARLRSEKPSPEIVAYIRKVAAEAMGNSFIDRLITRLENDQELKAALK